MATLLVAAPARAVDHTWFHDLELEALLRETQIDTAGPEPSGFTALDVAPFLTAQALASSNLAFSMAQVFDGRHLPRTAVGIDFTPWGIWGGSRWRLSDYKGNHDNRTVSRMQFSLALTKGDGPHDRSMHLAPGLRIVLHQERDPRVHRGTGSLMDCFERHVEVPLEERADQAALAARLDEVERVLEDPAADEAAREAALLEWNELEPRWEEAVYRYRRALRSIVGAGMSACREDPQLAAYAWNSTGLALGLSPTFRSPDERLGGLGLHGFSAWVTASYGFDRHGRLVNWTPSFLGGHAQILGQFMYRHHQFLPDPRERESYDEADQYVISTRLRGGTSPLSGSLEAGLRRDAFDDGDQDTYYELSTGADLRVLSATWVSLSLGRTFSRSRLPDETSLRISVKWAAL